MAVIADVRPLEEKAAASLTTQVYETLRQDILRGTLVPGKKLRIEELKESYGIGASAIREALSMLTSDLLVQRIDHRGFRVAEVSLSGFDELLRTRSWLEERALRESMSFGDLGWEESIVLANFHLSRAGRLESDDRFLAADRWERHHRALHRALIEHFSDLPHLLKLSDALSAQRSFVEAGLTLRQRDDLPTPIHISPSAGGQFTGART